MAAVPANPFGEKLQPRTGLGEGAEVRQVRRRAFLDVEGAFLDARAQKSLPLCVASVEDRSGTNKDRRRDNEARWPDEAEPLEVRENLRIELRHGRQLVSGQR